MGKEKAGSTDEKTGCKPKVQNTMINVTLNNKQGLWKSITPNIANVTVNINPLKTMRYTYYIA